MFRQECGAKIPLAVFGGVAHLVERYIRIVEVVSSSLIVSTNRVPRYADAYRGTSFLQFFLSRQIGIFFATSLQSSASVRKRVSGYFFFAVFSLASNRHLFCYIFTVECLGTQTRIGVLLFLQFFLSRFWSMMNMSSYRNWMTP